MKKNINHLKDWEMLEKKWQEKLANKEDSLPEDLWERIDERIGEREKGLGNSVEKTEIKSEKSEKSEKSVVLIRWSAAAAVLILMFFYKRIEVPSSAPVTSMASADKSDKSKNIFQSTESTVQVLAHLKSRQSQPQFSDKDNVLLLKSIQSEIKSVKSVPSVGSEIKSVKSVQSDESVVQTSVKSDESVESEIKSVKSDQLVESVVQAPADEMLVVVDIEPIKKEKVINKVIGFIKKVKSGRLLDLTTKNREGKLNDGIHRVMYQYEEKEEKLKNSLSL